MIRTAANKVAIRRIDESDGIRNEYDLLKPLLDKYVDGPIPFRCWGELTSAQEFIGHIIAVHFKKPDPAIFDIALLIELGADKMINQLKIDLGNLDFENLEPQSHKYANAIKRASELLEFGQILREKGKAVFIPTESECTQFRILLSFWEKKELPKIEQDRLVLSNRISPIAELILENASNEFD